MFSFFGNFTKLYGLSYQARIARVQFNSTLERKIKTGALKGIFLVCKWINNTIKSNSVRYHMCHGKNLSFLSSFRLRAIFVKRFLNSRICQHCDVKTSTVTPTFYYLFIIILTCYISVPSFIYNLCQVRLLRNHLKRVKADKNALILLLPSGAITLRHEITCFQTLLHCFTGNVT